MFSMGIGLNLHEFPSEKWKPSHVCVTKPWNKI